MTQLVSPMIGWLALGVAVSCWSHAVMRYAGRFGAACSAAVAAHDGSCSVVTFITALQLLKQPPPPPTAICRR